jgi:hypothetical protein
MSTSTDRPTDEDAGAPEREGGAWIGQHPDPNTDEVRADLDEGAERVATTANEAGDVPRDEWPAGHREGDDASDDDVRQAGKND